MDRPAIDMSDKIGTTIPVRFLKPRKPGTLTLVRKGKPLFEEIRSGRTVFIQRQRNKEDKRQDRVVQFDAWFLDYSMAEVRREVRQVLNQKPWKKAARKLVRSKFFSQTLQEI